MKKWFAIIRVFVYIFRNRRANVVLFLTGRASHTGTSDLWIV